MQCRYCYGKCIYELGQPFPFEVDDDLPTRITYNVKDLMKFLKRDTEPTIIFYGGEPTLEPDKMKEIMDNVQAKEYIMQTNGLLLDKIETDYIRRFSTILVSLDGNKSLTDYYRGKGTYRRVIANLNLLRNYGFQGEFIARMTVGPETDIRQAVNWLLFNGEFSFKSVHWQLDAQFWHSDYEKKHVKTWFEQYNNGVRRLVEDWIAHMEMTGEVLRVYPFVGVMESMLTGGMTKLRCGAGWTQFNIQTDGKITPCPVMAGMKSFYLGNIWETKPKRLINAILVKEPCPNCSVYGICGGRCLYANATKLWGDEGYSLVCRTVENLLNSLKAAQPKVLHLISRKVITGKDFNYPKYNSCEIIP